MTWPRALSPGGPAAAGRIHVEDAVDVDEGGEAILHAEEGARRVNAPYIIEAWPRPKDRVRRISRTASVRLALQCVLT
jgi:hypothetical protein